MNNKYNNIYKQTKQQLSDADKKATAAKTRQDVEGETEGCMNYSYYSRVLNKPFDSLTELRAEEAKYFDAQKAKETKALEKKADAAKVEEAFKALNKARKIYKESLIDLTKKYSEDLMQLKETFEANKKEYQDLMAKAEEGYSAAIKAFTTKYPEGYHLTLKDGDFETTISGSITNGNNTKATFGTNHALQMLDWFFNI